MDESGWIYFGNDGRTPHEPIRTAGLHECEVTEGSVPGTPSKRVELRHDGQWGWQTTDGDPYINPVARFLRCRRIAEG